jgi:hypothetical protein
MMHSCASAAKLRGGGPILFPGMKAKGGDRDPATSNRHRHPLALEARRAEAVGRFLCNSAHKGTQDDTLRDRGNLSSAAASASQAQATWVERLVRAVAAGAHEAAGHGARVFTVLEDRLSGNERRDIAIDALHKAATTPGMS